MSKILFLVPYPLHEAPSQRFRFEQYYTLLHESRYQYRVQSFFSNNGWKNLYTGNILKQIFYSFIGFTKRLYILASVNQFDFIFVHREITPIGPPIFEWVITKILKKKIIYDFDDAIWDTDKIGESRFSKILRWRSKVSSICRWSYKVSCGNDFLCEYAKKFNDLVVLNPTTIDTENLHNPDLYTKEMKSPYFTIGWTGSHTTLKHLNTIKDLILLLEQKYSSLRFLIIANKDPKISAKNIDYLPWHKENEVYDLQKIDIGIMPLPDDEWSKGKCGFKALQYMALGKPALVSPVGVNTKIVENGIDGFFCSTPEEWVNAIEILMFNKDLRAKMGVIAREKVVRQFSVVSNSANFLSLFQ